MENRLRTTISAYMKVSSAELNNYVRRDSLDTELKDYVKEAPDDGFTYARRNKHWIELEDSVVRNLRLICGASTKEQLDGTEIVNLGPAQDVYQEGKDTYTMIVSIPALKEDSYVWVCCSREVVSIGCQVPGSHAIPWIYSQVPATTVRGDDGAYYYCYRTNEQLQKDASWYLIITMKAHKDQA